MTTLQGITAQPTTIQPGASSTITVSATGDADRSYTIRGEVVGSMPVQSAEVEVRLDNADVVFKTIASQANPGDVLVTAPDGGTLSVTTVPGVFTFRP
jgi:hypothetical protein